VDLVAEADSGYHFVNWTGDVDTIADVNASSTTITMLDNYSIVANFEEEAPAENATLIGHVGLGTNAATNATVVFFSPGTHTELMRRYVTTDASGNFTADDLTPGTYDVAVKGNTSLAILKKGITLTAGETYDAGDFGLLREGDATGDDYVAAADFGKLSGAWLSYPGQGNWNPKCDFRRDNYISAPDYGLLSGNWLKWGDCYGWGINWS